MKRNKRLFIIIPFFAFVLSLGIVHLIPQEKPIISPLPKPETKVDTKTGTKPASQSDTEAWIRQLRKYAEIYSLIKTHYPEPVKEKKLSFSAIRGFLNTLDPHSYFLDPVSSRSMEEDQQGNYYGIGTRITKYEDRLTVVAALEGTPAQKMGILPGDVITEIDGKDTKTLSLDEAMRFLRGEKNTEVSIKIKREGYITLIPLKINRTEIPLNSVSYAFPLPNENNIGYINVRSFGNTTAKEFDDHLKKLLNENKIKALVLDLRGNPGGSLYSAIELSDFFLEKGKTIVSIKGKSIEHSYAAKKNGQYENLPVVVLINRGSASASEIVASALQDHQKATIIGSRSWGKGLVQTVSRLDLNTSLALTTAKYYTPKNKCLQRDFAQLDDYFFFLKYKNYDTDTSIQGGVMPDIPIKAEYYSEPVLKLISKGVFFKFARQLIKENFPIDANFKADDSVMKKFCDFLSKTNPPCDPNVLEKNSNTIRVEIERETLTQKLTSNDGMKAYLKSDPAILASINELKKKYLK